MEPADDDAREDARLEASPKLDTPDGASIEGFLERIALAAPSDDAAPAGETVVLMTIHIAKGLEWPIVFLTGLEDGLFPSLRERDGVSEDAQLEEERRLAYVAITRARQRLFLSYARTRRVWGEIRMQDPSRFLLDLPPDSVAAARRHGTTIPPRPAASFARGSGGGGGGGGGMPPRKRRDEFDQRAPEDDLPVYRVDADVGSGGAGGETFRSGDAVTHELHGLGKVIAVSGSGRETKVIVDFQMAGRKTVFAKYLSGDAN
jgi:DNA helicase-2/ATP-dependent DNA helicase PcrA